MTNLIQSIVHDGRPMQQIDIQIAAIAITIGQCTVATLDSDLSDILGLSEKIWEKVL